MKIHHYLIVIVLLILSCGIVDAKDEILTVAVFNFESPDESVRDLGPKVAVLVTADLSTNPQLITVERAELEKALGEQEIGLSGTIQPETAAKVGHLTGAQVLITGRVFKVDHEMVMVAKIIGTETSRVYGEVVKGSSIVSPSEMSAQLAKKIADTIAQKSETLIAKVEKIEDRIEKIRKSLKTEKLPVVEVNIPERHFGGPTFDPAAQTEISFFLEKCGFTVVNAKSSEKPELEFIGEAFSEFGMRKGNLVSCKGHIELKVIDKATGKILVIDRQTSVAVDLSEQIAGKTSLQKAVQELAERMIPKVTK